MILLRYTAKIFKDRDATKARVFFLRSFLHYPQVISWLKFIDAFYKKYGFKSAPWDIASLPVRKYVSGNFGITKKLSLLKTHYENLEKFFPSQEIKKLLAKDDFITISNIAKKDGEECQIQIAILSRFHREGGLTMSLVNKEKIITTLTFNFYNDKNGKPAIIISGLQGGSEADKSDIVSITRSLGGLRPKYALIECCYSIASCCGIKSITGVSDKNHIFSRYSNKPKGSYDAIWKDIGGTIDSDKNYLLPESLVKRDFQSVPQKKRKDWLIRHGHISKMNADIAEFFGKEFS